MKTIKVVVEMEAPDCADPRNVGSNVYQLLMRGGYKNVDIKQSVAVQQEKK